MKAFGSIESVRVAIQEDARAEVEKTESDAAAVIVRLREEDARIPVAVVDADLRLAAARRHARERLAEEDRADRQAVLNARETWIARVAAHGQQRLRALEPEARQNELRRLAREAVARIGGEGADVLVPVADATLADASFRSDLEAASHKAVTITPTADVVGGCIARTVDGRMRYDNTYIARARRSESRWRVALGGLFDRAPALASHSGSGVVRS